MAEKNIVVSEYTLCCSICLERFVRPRSLPCQHSFCSLCLVGYVEQVCRSRTPPNTGFNCPCCRGSISIPVDVNIEKWVEKFPLNLTLLSILDSKQEKPSMQAGNCGECIRDDIEQKANFYCMECEESLCGDCKRGHQRNKASSNHKVYKIESSEEDHNSFRFDILKDLGKCAKHPTLAVTFHCRDHNDYCCDKCAIVNHRKCNNLATIEEMVQAGEEDDSSESLNKELTVVKEGCDELMQFHRDQEKLLETSKDQVKLHVRTVKHDIEMLATALEGRVGKELDQHQGYCIAKISDGSASVRTVRDNAEHLKLIMETASKYGNSQHQYFAKLNLEKCITESKQSLASTYKGLKSKKLVLSGYSEAQLALQRALDSINIQVEDSTDILPKCRLIECNPYSEKQAALELDISIKGNCYIGGCVLLTPTLLVLSGRNDKTLGLVDLNKKGVIKTFACTSKPWHLTQIGKFNVTGKCDVAVVFNEEKMIRLLKICDTTLTYDAEIEIPETCSGLAFDKKSKTMLTILQTSGNIARVTMDGCIEYLYIEEGKRDDIRKSYCLAYSKKLNRIYVSSHFSNKLITLDSTGKLIFEYAPIALPWGIELDTEDNIYICSYGESSIFQIDSSGNFIRKILTRDNKIDKPLSMTWSKDKNSFYLTCPGSVKRYTFM